MVALVGHTGGPVRRSGACSARRRRCRCCCTSRLPDPVAVARDHGRGVVVVPARCCCSSSGSSSAGAKVWLAFAAFVPLVLISFFVDSGWRQARAPLAGRASWRCCSCRTARQCMVKRAGLTFSNSIAIGLLVSPMEHEVENRTTIGGPVFRWIPRLRAPGFLSACLAQMIGTPARPRYKLRSGLPEGLGPMPPQSKPPFRAGPGRARPARPPELRMAARPRRGARSAARRCARSRTAASVMWWRSRRRSGCPAVTDGEFRRDWWHIDFLEGFDGVETVADPSVRAAFHGADEAVPVLTVTGKVRRSRPVMVEPFKFLKSVTKRTAKLTIPSPSMLHMRGGRPAISREAYPDLDEFWADVAQAYRDEIRDLAAAGCTYLQLDDVSFAYLCDEKFRARLPQSRRRPGARAAHLRGGDQCRAARSPARDDGHRPHLSRQLQEHVDGLRRLRPVAEVAFGGLDVDGYLSRIRHRARRRLRAAALRAQGQEGRARAGHAARAPSWNPRTRSSAASTKRRSTCRWRTCA